MKELYNENVNYVCGVMDEIEQEDNNLKSRLVNLWKRNIHFTNGIQNLQAGTGSATETTNGLSISRNISNRKQAYQSNEIRPIVRTLVSYMTRSKPTVDVFAADKTDESKLSAAVVKKVLEAKHDLDNETEISRQAAYWGLTTGTVFRKDFFDPSLSQEIAIPKYDEAQNEMINPETGEPEMQSTGGDNNIAILTGFNISFDWFAASFEELSWIKEDYIVDVEWAQEVFNQKDKGHLGNADKIGSSKEFGLSLATLQELKTATPGNQSAGGVGSFSNKDKTRIREIYIRPTREYPKGRLIVKAGDIAVFDGESPYCFKNMSGDWHPYTEWVYEPFIGRLLGKSLVEELIQLQVRLNEINGAILENANTLAQPDMLVSKLAQMKQGVFRGGGKRVYRWSGVGPEPRKWDGQALPKQFFKERESIIDEMVRLAGTNFVMSGSPPTGVTAAAAIESLLQNASSSQTDTMNSWEKFHERGLTKKINVIKKFYQFPNKKLIDYVKALSGDTLSNEIEAFTGESISDGISVKIEFGSMIPKSEKIRHDTMMGLMKEGALGPVQEDSPRGAVLREKIQRELGIFDLDLEDSKDVEKARWENQRLKEGKPADFQQYDNHAIHKYILATMLKDPLFIEKTPPEIKKFVMDHDQEHGLAMQMMEEQAMMKQLQMQQMQQGLPPTEGGQGELPTTEAPPEAGMQ